MRGADGAERFFDDFAGVYDLVYADHDFDDVAFYVDRARATEGPVLEAACGTGRVYLELLRAGVDADGFDVSRGMLDELERKAERAGLDPSVRKADMTVFEPRREYALVIVPFRSFLHNLTVADQVAALERFEAALAPDGELVFNVFPPDFGEICNEYDESRESYLTVDGVTFREERVSRFADEVEQVVSFQWLFQRVAPGEDVDADRKLDVDADRELDIDLPGEVPSLLVNEFRLSLISKQAFEALFRAAGYDEWAVYGGFDLAPFESTDQEMVWIASP